MKNVCRFNLLIHNILVKSVAHALDEGIINGEGDYDAVFEPVGVLMNLSEDNIVTVPFTAADILSQIELIDTGSKKDIGEVIAVMKRKTYYKDILALSNNSLPYPNISGLRVKFSGAVEDDELILGDFKEYILGERNQMRIEQSSDYLYLEDQTVFKVVARYDGKPHNEKAFVKITKQTDED